MMKKLLFILLAVFVLVGCSQDEDELTETDDQATEDVADGDADENAAEDVDSNEQNGATATDDTDSSEQDREDVNADSEEIVALAEEFIGQLANEEFEVATQHFNEMMEAQLTPVALDELWVALQDQLGAFIDQEYSSIEEVDDHQVVLIDGLFEGADVVFSVTFDNNNQIAGFYIQ